MGRIEQLEEENFRLKYLIAQILFEVSEENIERVRNEVEPNYPYVWVVGTVRGLLSVYDSGRKGGAR